MFTKFLIHLFAISLFSQMCFADTKPLAFFVGHSSVSKGSKSTQLPAEWDYCSAIGKEVVKLAPKYGIKAKVFYRPKGSYSRAVAKMHEEKNDWARNAPVVSCHYNAAPVKIDDVQLHGTKIRELFVDGKPPKSGSLMGTLILYKPNPETERTAQKLLENVQSIMPRNDTRFIDVSSIIPVDTNDRGAREVLSKDRSSVMMLEIGYGDNPVDIAIMSQPNFQKQLAEKILLTFK